MTNQLLIINTSQYGDYLLDQSTTLLTEREQQRAMSFFCAEDSELYRMGRSLLRTTLAEVIGCNPTELQFTYNKHDKPSLCEPLNTWHFNLAKTSPMLALAISSDGPVGVDIECFDIATNWQVLAKASLHPSELQLLQQLATTADRLELVKAFNQYWVLKEAYLKCLGTGLTYPSTKFWVEWDKQGVARFHDKDASHAAVKLAGQLYLGTGGKVTTGNDAAETEWVAAVVSPHSNVQQRFAVRSWPFRTE